MIDIPEGRISGSTLRALVLAARHTPAVHLASRVFRHQLGIDTLKRLPEAARGPLPLSYLPVRANRSKKPVGNFEEHQLREPWPTTSAHYEKLFNAGALDPRELCERAIVAAKDLSAKNLGAFYQLDEAGARKAAEAAYQRFQAGKPLGPLDGIPVAIKEEVHYQGLSTRLGSKASSPSLAEADSTCVARLRAAGAVLLGQTCMTEFGLSPLGCNTNRKMPRNAHHPGHLPGGSSTGSGVAVATGLTPVSLGVDGGGSIRIPAAWNGVFGLKPTFGRIPASGHGSAGGSSVVHLGPIACSVRDLAIFLEATLGADDNDWSSLGAPPVRADELQNALNRGVQGLKIGIIDSEWNAASGEVAEVGMRALKALEQRGAELIRVELPLARYASTIGYLSIGLESYTGLTEIRKENANLLGLDVQLLTSVMGAFLSDDYLDAQRLRAKLREETANLLRQVDVLALPTTAATAPAITASEEQSGFLDPPALEDACRFAFLGNLTGIPAGTAPVGFGKNGLPIGLQILGDAYDEATVLQVLAVLERSEIAKVERPSHGVQLLDG